MGRSELGYIWSDCIGSDMRGRTVSIRLEGEAGSLRRTRLDTGLGLGQGGRTGESGSRGRKQGNQGVRGENRGFRGRNRRIRGQGWKNKGNQGAITGG